jgi:hypothetical protein
VEEIARFTQQAAQTQVAAVPTMPSSTPAPTLDATPTFITAEAPSIPPTNVPTAPAPENADPNLFNATTFTPSPPPTVALRLDEIPATVSRSLQLPPTPSFSIFPGTRAFAISAGAGNFVAGTFETGGITDTVLFARNPANPNEYAFVNTTGQLFIGSPSGALGISGNPFTQFTYQVIGRDNNNAAVGNISYSANGQLATIIDAGKENIDGVWLYENGGLRQVLRDCPYENHPGCYTVQPSGARVETPTWRSQEIKWPPLFNGTMLVEVALPNEGREAFVLVNLAEANPEVVPPLIRYDSAEWSADGARVIVSGISGGGQPEVAILDPITRTQTVIYNGAGQLRYPRSAAQRSDGQVTALANHLFDGGAVQLIDMGGNALSQPIGSAAPSRIAWSADGSTALVQTEDGHSFVVNAFTGAITELTNQVGANPINFVQGALPPTAVADGGIPAALPSGVIEGSRYAPGQQLRVQNPTGLNLRAQPSMAGTIVGGVLINNYVAILAGPVQAESIEWWQVRAADGNSGWIAAQINGLDTLTP